MHGHLSYSLFVLTGDRVFGNRWWCDSKLLSRGSTQGLGRYQWRMSAYYGQEKVTFYHIYSLT